MEKKDVFTIFIIASLLVVFYYWTLKPVIEDIEMISKFAEKANKLL